MSSPFDSCSRDPLVWVSLINEGYLPFARHFCANLRRLGYSDGSVVAATAFPLVIFCTDTATLDKTRVFWKHCMLLEERALDEGCLSTELTAFLTREYKRIVFAKLDVLARGLRECARIGAVFLGYIDFDIALLADPTPAVLEAFHAHADASCVTQCDEDRTPVCSNPSRCPLMCSGIMALRVCDAQRLQPALVYTHSALDSFCGDQDFLMVRMNALGLQRWTLDKTTFPNGAGSAADVRGARSPDTIARSVAIHFNYLFGREKEAAMRRWGLWCGDDAQPQPQPPRSHVHTLREWQRLPKDVDDLIVQASAEDGSDAWNPEPIGMQWSFTKLSTAQRSDLLRCSSAARLSAAAPSLAAAGAGVAGGAGGGSEDRPKLLLNAFRTETDLARRRHDACTRHSAQRTLEGLGYPRGNFGAADYFLHELQRAKFVASPEGNGIDCHRHYEALIAGAVPIMEDRAETRAKYAGCPVVWTRDFSELTPEVLEATYARMLDTEYDFAALMLSSYTAEQQAAIKRRGNHWTRRCGSGTWYA